MVAGAAVAERMRLTNAGLVLTAPLAQVSGGTGVSTARVSIFSVSVTVNFNAANTDTPVTLQMPAGFTRIRVQTVIISGASASISTATVGVFTGAGGTGATIVANQAITITTAADETNNNAQTVNLTNGTTETYTDTAWFVRVGTAQGSAATGTVTIAYFALP